MSLAPLNPNSLYHMLPPGSGKAFEKDMQKMVENVRRALRAAFENEDYQNRRQAVTKEFQEKQQNAFQELKEKVEKEGLTIVRTPSGISFAPGSIRDDLIQGTVDVGVDETEAFFLEDCRHGPLAE